MFIDSQGEGGTSGEREIDREIERVRGIGRRLERVRRDTWAKEV